VPLTRETLQLRKGTQNEHAVFTGLPGEMTIDTTRDIPVIHDGVKLGGYPIIPIDILPNGNDFNIVTPHLLTPVQGDAGFVGVVEISPYTNQLVFEGVHGSTDWQIATDGMFTNVIRESLKDTINLTRNMFYGLSTDAPVFIRVRYISGEHLSGWSPTVQVTPMLKLITTPTVQVEGSPSSVPESPTLTSSPFVTFNSNETHASSTWTVTDTSGLVVWESVDSPDLTSVKIPLGVLTANTTYVFSVLYKSLTLTSLPGTVQAITVLVFPRIETPTVQVEGGPSSVPLAPVISGSPFVSQGVQAGHTSTDWQVLDSFGTVFWESLGDTVNLTSMLLPAGLLNLATSYTFVVVYHSDLVQSLEGSVQGATITPFVETPTLQVQGSPTSVPENPTLTSSAFVVQGINETHVSTDWSVKDANGVVVWSSLSDTVNLTTARVPLGILMPNTGYVFSVIYHSRLLTSAPGTLGARTVLNYPSILTPTVRIEGGPSSVPLAPVISTSPFAMLGTTEIHVSTDWVVRNSSGVQTWTVQGDTVNLTSIKMPSGIVQVGGTYTFEARFNTQTLTSLYGSVQAGTIAAVLNDPTISVEGGPALVPENPTLSSSVLSSVGNAGTHVSSDWQVKNSSGQAIWSSLGNVSSLTSIQIPRGVLAVNTSYTFEVRHHTSTLTTGWGSVTAVTKAQFAFIETPTISVEGSATKLPENPILTSSAYVITGAVESHASTDWIVTDSSGVTVWSSVGDLANLTTITMPKGILQVNTSYTFTVKYNSATLTSGLGTATWTTPAQFPYVYQDVWTAKLPMPENVVSYSQSTLLDGTVFVTGGYISPYTTAITFPAYSYAYNPTTDIWTAKKAMPIQVFNHRITTLQNGNVLTVGGYDGTRSISTVYSYNPTSDTWTIKSPLPTAVNGQGQSILLDGTVMVTGGSTSSSSGTTAVHLYNPTTDTWTLGANLPVSIYAHGQSTALNGDVYITGGYGYTMDIWGNSQFRAQETVYIYKASLGLWIKSTNLPIKAYYHTQITMMTGTIVIIGGYSMLLSGIITPSIPSHYALNMATGIWYTIAPEPTVFGTLSNPSNLLSGPVFFASIDTPDGSHPSYTYG